MKPRRDTINRVLLHLLTDPDGQSIVAKALGPWKHWPGAGSTEKWPELPLLDVWSRQSLRCHQYASVSSRRKVKDGPLEIEWHVYYGTNSTQGTAETPEEALRLCDEALVAAGFSLAG